MTTTTYIPVSLDKIDTLDSSTLGIIELAKALLKDKEYLPKAEFNKMIQSFGWGRGLMQSYIKIAQAFGDVEINKLARIEPRTLFKITSSKKFASVVKGITDTIGHVTQQLVDNLIEACRIPRVTKPDEPTIWRAEKDGSRSCVVPPIKEDDQFTGLSIQRAMDSEGISAQLFVREAAAFREAWLSGVFLLVGKLPPHLEAILGEKLEYNAPTAVDDIEVNTYTSQTETAETTVEVAETMEYSVASMEVPQIILAIPESIETSIDVFEDLKLNNSIESMSFEKIAALLVQCTTWNEIVAITSKIDEQVRLKSWDMLCESQQQRIITMEEHCSPIPSIKVGDKVNWANHYPHLSAWLPLKVEEINDGKVKLELCDFLVPIEELSLIS
jgi:hypothetical protein